MSDPHHTRHVDVEGSIASPAPSSPASSNPAAAGLRAVEILGGAAALCLLGFGLLAVSANAGSGLPDWHPYRLAAGLSFALTTTLIASLWGRRRDQISSRAGDPSALSD